VSSNILIVLLKNKRGRYQKILFFGFGYDIQRYNEDNVVNIQANSDSKDVIDHLVDRTTVSIHDRVHIDIANVDIDDYEPPVIISKADEATSPIIFTKNPMLKTKVEDY
jgi:hypothetical protein